MTLRIFAFSLSLLFMSASTISMNNNFPDVAAILKVSHRKEHPVSNPNIAHYSLYRRYSISTHINHNDPEPQAGCNYYVIRTITKYPNEGEKITYSGTQERPMYKEAKLKTGENTSEIRKTLINTRIEALFSEKAKMLFSNYVANYKLFDKSPEEWFKEITEKSETKIPDNN